MVVDAGSVEGETVNRIEFKRTTFACTGILPELPPYGHGTIIFGRSRSIVARRFASVKFGGPPTGMKSTSTLPIFNASDGVIASSIAPKSQNLTPSIAKTYATFSRPVAARFSELVRTPRTRMPLARFTPVAIELRKICGEPAAKSVKFAISSS